MDQVLEHAAGDLIVADRRPGARLADVQQAARQARPAARARRDRARAPASAARWRRTPAARAGCVTGTARDLLIGITVVRADGVVAKAGGRVVKNVAGYDLGKLLIGSFGTLARGHRGGVPAAPAARGAAAGSPSRSPTPAAAHELGARRWCTRRRCPAAVEVDWPGDGAGQRAACCSAGTADGVDGPGAARSAALLGADADESADEAPAGWATYPWERRGDDRRCKLTFVLSGLPTCSPPPRDAGAARARVGRHRRASTPRRRRTPSRGAPAVERLRAVCARHGGSVVVVDAPAAVKQPSTSGARCPRST